MAKKKDSCPIDKKNCKSTSKKSCKKNCSKKSCETKESAQKRCNNSLPELETVEVVSQPSLWSRVKSLFGL